MKIDVFKTREFEGRLYVYVEVPMESASTPRIRLDLKDIENILKEKGISHGRCLAGKPLKNWRDSTRKKEWIFDLSLDKPSKPVIIKEEKSVQPKPTRKKRTRSSAKKVSTED